MALGRGSSNAQGGMLPRAGQGAVYAPAWQGARKSEQVSKLFRAQLKHTFPGRGICMENGGGKLPPLVPSLEGRVRDDQVKSSRLQIHLAVASVLGFPVISRQPGGHGGGDPILEQVFLEPMMPRVTQTVKN